MCRVLYMCVIVLIREAWGDWVVQDGGKRTALNAFRFGLLPVAVDAACMCNGMRLIVSWFWGWNDAVRHEGHRGRVNFGWSSAAIRLISGNTPSTLVYMCVNVECVCECRECVIEKRAPRGEMKRKTGFQQERKLRKQPQKSNKRTVANVSLLEPLFRVSCVFRFPAGDGEWFVIWSEQKVTKRRKWPLLLFVTAAKETWKDMFKERQLFLLATKTNNNLLTRNVKT